MGDPRWLTPRQARAWRGYRRMRALLDLRLAGDLARDSGLSEADYDVLSSLSEAADHRIRLGILASHLRWSPSRLSHQLSRMRQRGLIDKEDAPGDGRGAIIVLTAEGWRTIERAAPRHVDSVRENFIDLLSDRQLSALAEIAGTVVDALADDDVDPAFSHRPGLPAERSSGRSPTEQ